MYKVFFNEQIIYIDSEKDNSVLQVEVNSLQEIPQLLFNFFENDEDLFIFSETPEKILVGLKDELKYLEAAGGLVENEDEELLFIYRLDYWDLPKGMIEEGEIPEKAAYREISEECGIKSHKLEKHLIDTYHIFSRNGEMHLKKTFWYSFSMGDSSEEVIPQTEEDIELVSWLGEDEIQLALLDTYESIKEIYQAYLEK